MKIFGVELHQKLLSFLIFGLIGFGWVSREISWYTHYNLKDNEIQKLMRENEILKLKLEIEEASQTFCKEIVDEVSIEEKSNSTAFLRLQELTGSNHLKLLPSPVLFDFSGWLYIFLCGSLIYYEIYSHEKTYEEVEQQDNKIIKQICVRFKDFIAKKHPVTCLIIFSLIFLGSIPAWWGLISRNEFINLSYKISFCLVIASPITFFIHNFLRLVKYFPTDKSEFNKSIRDIHWWIWVFTRTIGINDLFTGTSTILWFSCLIWYSWPIRYFFFYRFTSLEITENNNLFFVNMIGHLSYLIICGFLLYSLVFLPPPISKNQNEGNEEKEVKKDSLWIKILRKLNNPTFCAIIAISSTVFSIIAVLRIFWFLFFTSTERTWYCWFVTWIFIHIHVGLILFALPALNVLVQKYSVISDHKEEFLSKFNKLNEESEGDKEDEKKENNEENIEAANELFNWVLSYSILFFLFIDDNVKSPEEDSTQGSKEEGKKNNNQLNAVFNMMLQVVAETISQMESETEKENEKND